MSIPPPALASYTLESRPESGAEVLMSGWTSLNFGCLESPSNSKMTLSLVEINAPAALNRCVCVGVCVGVECGCGCVCGRVCVGGVVSLLSTEGVQWNL